MKSLDLNIFHFLNSFIHISTVIDTLIIFFSQYYVFVVGLIFLITIYKLPKSKKERIKILLFTVGITGIVRFGIMELIHLFDQRLRPFIELSAPHLFVVHAYSFPSGHTTFVFALATVAWYYHQKTSYFIFVSGLIIGIARIMAGVHYPSDILGGIIVGVVSAYVLVLIAQKLFPQHTHIKRQG